MTPAGNIRLDARSDNRGGLRVVIEDVEHIITLRSTQCLFVGNECGIATTYDPDPGPLLYGAPRRRTGHIILSRDDGDEIPHLMITVYPDRTYLALTSEVAAVWGGTRDICKVVSVKEREVVYT